MPASPLLMTLNASAELLAILVSVALAFTGYLISHWSNLRRQRLEARLRFASQQLERLYGPLYALVQANTASWQAFRRSFRPDQPLFDPGKPFDAREGQIWRAWAEHVFIPSNLKIRDVIEANAHLVMGGRMPPEFLAILAHIESSKMVLPALADGDLGLLDQFDPWPDTFNGFVEDSYAKIAAEHGRLMGHFRR